MSRSMLQVLIVCLFPVSLHAADAPWRKLPLIENGQVAPVWQQAGWWKMVVEGDAIRTDPSEKGLGLAVYTKEKFGNCQIRVVYRPKNERCNAGVHIRMDDGILKWVGRDSIAVERDAKGKLPPEMRTKMEEASKNEEGAWYAVHHGFEVQIMDAGGDPLHRTGAVYSLGPAAELPPASADGWRTMIITLEGTLVLVEVDGKSLTRFDSDAKYFPERKQWYEPKRENRRPEFGYIGLQTHDPGDVVYFREVSVRPLEKP